MNAFGPFGKNTEYNSKTDERKREKILSADRRGCICMKSE